MNNKLLIGIIVAIVILLVVVEIWGGSQILFVNHFIIWVPLAVWAFFAWMVWKKGASIFREKMEPELAERRLKWLKIFMLFGGISWALVYFFIPNVWVAITGQYGIEGALFLIPFILGLLFFVGIVGSLVIYFKGRRKAT